MIDRQAIAEASSDPVSERRPGVCEMRWQFLIENPIEQRQPDGEMLCSHVPCGLVNLHRIAVVTPLIQQGVSPEPPDFFFMGRPIHYMRRKNRAERRVSTDARVELRHDPVDLLLCNGYAWRHGHATMIQTTARQTAR